MGIAEACYRIIGDLLQALKCSRRSSTPHIDEDDHTVDSKAHSVGKLEDAMVRALITVFGMENNGKIKKKNVRRVVENLGLLYGSKEDKKDSNFELPCQCGLDNDDLPAEEVLGEVEDESNRSQLLHEAFKIFDEDGNGFIEAVELKRVLECLGLDRGWDMTEIEKMVKVVDLNLDGKVDFSEFELMMK